MADAEDAKSLGPWKDANLRATTRVDAGLGADAGVRPDWRISINLRICQSQPQR